MSQTFNPPKPITFQISGNLTVSFNMLPSTTSAPFQQSMKKRMSISIESSQLQLFSEFLEILGKVRDFLCLAFDRTVSYTFVAGYRRVSLIRVMRPPWARVIRTCIRFQPMGQSPSLSPSSFR